MTTQKICLGIKFKILISLVTALIPFSFRAVQSSTDWKSSVCYLSPIFMKIINHTYVHTYTYTPNFEINDIILKRGSNLLPRSLILIFRCLAYWISAQQTGKFAISSYMKCSYNNIILIKISQLMFRLFIYIAKTAICVWLCQEARVFFFKKSDNVIICPFDNRTIEVATALSLKEKLNYRNFNRGSEWSCFRKIALNKVLILKSTDRI